MTPDAPLRIVPVSDRALLIEYPDLDHAIRHYAALTAVTLGGVDELVPAARTMLVRFDPTAVDAPALASALRGVAPVESLTTELAPVTIDVVYDGGDLGEVAEHLGLSVDELITRHTAANWRVAFTGYAPGFAYCVGDDPIFQVPRRATPRTRIPAGSVGLAAEFSGIYPREAPGGWQLIGRTGASMWDLDRQPPALLQPGQPVQYRAVREVVPTAAAGAPAASAVATGPALVVERPGAQALLQDLGRPGLLGMGVPASGAADRRALRAANRIVGNPSNTAAIEIAGGGTTLRVRGAAVIAVTGASGPRSILAVDGTEVPLERGTPTAVDDGDLVRIGAFDRGMRGYLAVRGGFAAPKVLGSVATDTLAGVGAAPLQADDELPINTDAVLRAVDVNDPVRPELPADGEVVSLDLVLGPRTDWFTATGLQTLLHTEWVVTAQSNRVGVRLAGDTPIERAQSGELPSEGAVTGAIQVPPDGQPVLFLADHPLTGGYPVIGAVVDRDLDLAGQLAAGVRVRFRALHDFTEL